MNDLQLVRIFFVFLLAGAAYILAPFQLAAGPAAAAGACLGLAIVLFEIRLKQVSLKRLIGAAIGYRGADWPGVRARICHPYIPTAVLLYVPWALLQQTLFQFYLLGRVRTLCPSFHPLSLSALNGLIFGLVHATDVWIALPAALGGILWSFLYLRYRRLWPLAVSHALIGTTFYYWVYGLDLASRWTGFLHSLAK